MGEELKLYCFFCSERLKSVTLPSRWICPSCRASFQAELDQEGCIRRLQVASCGTPDCCQQEPGEHSL